MSCGGTLDAQVLFLHDLSESVLSLLQAFPFCRVPFDGTSFLDMSGLLVALSPWSFPRFEECFSLHVGLFVLGLASLAPAGGFSATVYTLWWGLTMGLVGGSTLGDFSWDFIFFFFLGWSLPLPAITSQGGACCIIANLPGAGRLCFQSLAMLEVGGHLLP